MSSGSADVVRESKIGFLPILAANLLPLAGVLALDWEPATLALVYCTEVLLSVLLAGLKAPFAQQPPGDHREGVLSVGNAALTERRGSVDLAGLPPVYIRNLPFTFGVFGGVAWTGIFLLAVLSRFQDPLVGVSDPVVLASIGALLVGQVRDIAKRYVGQKRYETVSPYAVVDTPLRQAFVLVVLTVVTGVGPEAVLGALVFGKIVVEWAGYSGADKGLLSWVTGPERSEKRGRQEPLDVPDGPPTAELRPDRRAVLLTGLFRALVRAPWTLLLLFILWTVLVGLSDVPFASPLAVVVATLLFGVVLPAAVCRRVLGYYLTHGTARYQLRDSTLVASDALVGTPQWAGEVGAFRNVDVRDGYLADRLFNSRTITLQTRRSDELRTLAHVAEPDRLVRTFDMPVVTTELGPMHRGIAALAVVLGVGLTAGAVTLLSAPGAPPERHLFVVFLFPPALLLTTVVWKLSYPDDLSELVGAD